MEQGVTLLGVQQRLKLLQLSALALKPCGQLDQCLSLLHVLGLHLWTLVGVSWVP